MKISIFSATALVVALSACGPVRPEDRMCQFEQLSSDGAEAKAQQNAFFPEGFAEEPTSDECGTVRPRLSEIETEWYPSQWQAACETPLLDTKQAVEGDAFTLRFSYLPSFDHPLFLRLEKREERHLLIIKEMTGAGGYEPGIISRSKEVELSNDDLRFVYKKLEELRADRAAEAARLAREGPKDICFGTLDGTMWILEVVEEGQYDMFEFNSPNKGALYELGTLLLDKSGWVPTDSG